MITKTRTIRLTTWIDEETGNPESAYELLKPLSDEEIIELFENPDDFSCIEFARAIERKHGIL